MTHERNLAGEIQRKTAEIEHWPAWAKPYEPQTPQRPHAPPATHSPPNPRRDAPQGDRPTSHRH